MSKPGYNHRGYPDYPSGNSMTGTEWNWHRLGWIPATKLEAWKQRKQNQEQ